MFCRATAVATLTGSSPCRPDENRLQLICCTQRPKGQSVGGHHVGNDLRTQSCRRRMDRRRPSRARHQSIRHDRGRRGISTRQPRGCRAGHRGGEGRVSQVVAIHAAGAARCAQTHRRRAPGAQGRDRRGCSRARRARRWPRASARRPARRRSSCSSAGEALRQTGEKLASVRPGVDVEITREPRRRGRPDLPVELPDRDPGLEDRTGARLRQLRRAQAGGARAGDRAPRWPRSSPAPACRRACSTWSWAAAPWSARRCSGIRA